MILAAGAVYYFVFQKKTISLYTNSSPSPVESVQPVPVSPTPSSKSDPTASWKTYTNSVQNYSFKYSPDWSADLSQANLDPNSFLVLTRDQVKLRVDANMYGIGGVGQDFQGTKTTVSGITLYEYKVANSYNNTQMIGITDTLAQSLGLFQYKGKTYSISLSYPNSFDQSQKGADLQKEYDLILSTFKFTN